jgi:hypothetical protein
MRYNEYLQSLKDSKSKTMAGKRENQIQQQIIESRAKKLKLASALEHLTHEADELASQSEERCDISLLSQSNKIRSTAANLKKKMDCEVQNVKLFKEKLNMHVILNE